MKAVRELILEDIERILELPDGIEQQKLAVSIACGVTVEEVSKMKAKQWFQTWQEVASANGLG